MIGRHILRQSLLDLNNQSVPYMFDLPPPSSSAPVLSASQPVNSFHSKFQNRTSNIHSSCAISGSRTTSNTNSFHSKVHNRTRNIHSSSAISGSRTTSNTSLPTSPHGSARSHRAVEPTMQSLLISNIFTTTTSVISDSEDTMDKQNPSTTTYTTTHLQQKDNDSEDSEDTSAANNRPVDQTISKTSSTTHHNGPYKKSDHCRIRTSKVITKVTDSSIKHNTEDHEIKYNSNENSENSSVDNDVDGGHGFLFLNSESDDEGGSPHSLNAEGPLHRKQNHALNKKRRYWEKKFASKENIGLLVHQDDDLLQFPDGAQYRLK